jgi:glycosyltransferase involved in cell wall biosynthesis
MLDILVACAADGWSTAAVVPPGSALDGFASELEEAGAMVTRIGPLFESERSFVRNLVELVRLMRRLRPAVVHLHFPWAPTCFEAILACAVARVPVVVRTEHNPIGTRLGTKQVFKLKLLDRLVDVIVCVSTSNRNGHVENGRRNNSQFEVIPNGVEQSEGPVRPRSEIREELGIAEETIAVVMVGALEERKGVMDLVRAAALVDASVNIRFFVIGEGEMRDSAERLASELGVDDRVRFLGRRADVQQLMTAVDIFAQPSHYEGMSLAMLEALESGLPMVTTLVDGVVDVLPDGEGAIVCPVGDPIAFAAGVTELAVSASLRRRLAAITSVRVRSSFTRLQMTDAYLDLYRRLLGSPPNPNL